MVLVCSATYTTAFTGLTETSFSVISLKFFGILLDISRQRVTRLDI